MGEDCVLFFFVEFQRGMILYQRKPYPQIVAFFNHQPEEAFTYFRPHKFDDNCINRLQKNLSFLAYVLLDKANDQIAGYCFNRCFFHGDGYRGRMVESTLVLSH